MSDTAASWLFFLAIGSLVVFLAVLAAKERAKRIAAIRAWGAAHGLSFSREKDRQMERRYPFDCFREGSNRYAENVCAGRIGDYFVRAFDYHYQTEHTDSKGHESTTHHHYSAVVVETQFPMNPLAIRTENLGDKLGGLLGLGDIDFELAEFNREFWVKSADRRWAFDV